MDPGHRSSDRERDGHGQAGAGGTAHHTGRPAQRISRQRLLGRAGFLQVLHGKQQNKLSSSHSMRLVYKMCTQEMI